MNSLERSLAVIEGHIPDRVPVCLLSFPNTARHAGYSIGEFCLSGEKMAAAHLGYWEEFRHDMIQLENGIAALAEAAGCAVEYADDEPPWVTRPAIRSLDEVERLREIDLQSPAVAALLQATALLAGKIGDSVCIRGDSDQGPFSLASQILGHEAFFFALMDPEQHARIHRLLEYSTEQVKRLARALSAAGSHFTVIGDSIAGPNVCSPGIYRQFAAPYERRAVESLRAEGIEMGTHICGNATSIIRDMLSTGARCFELDYQIDRLAVREATRGRATLIGTLDPSNLVPRGTPDEVAVKAREDIRILAPGGRFILGAGCTIPRETPAANVRALVRAAAECGIYRPDGTLAAEDRPTVKDFSGGKSYDWASRS
jgi:MtaA/CmuA family methyltransferase